MLCVQLECLENYLRGSDATYKIVAGHYPIFSTGEVAYYALLQVQACISSALFSLCYLFVSHLRRAVVAHVGRQGLMCVPVVFNFLMSCHFVVGLVVLCPS